MFSVISNCSSLLETGSEAFSLTHSTDSGLGWVGGCFFSHSMGIANDSYQADATGSESNPENPNKRKHREI